MAKRFRADALVHEQGLVDSVEMAARLIMAGNVVFLDAEGRTRPVAKPGHPFTADTRFQLAGIERFVSRGAYKLLTALEAFQIDVAGFVCLDAGASTGGFTDCLLQHGAAKVYAVDVGKAQLHERLRADPRVISREGVNLRVAPQDLIPEPIDIVVADVSFISLTKVLPHCLNRLRPDGHVVALVKPQFELESKYTEKGVVRDPLLREQALRSVIDFCTHTLHLTEKGVVPAAIKGPKGNQEYLLWCMRCSDMSL